MKVFLDDERSCPEGWVQVKTAQEAITLLQAGGVEEISLDHDLGDDEQGTGYTVLQWIEDCVAMDGLVPPIMHVHTANPAARVRMEAAVEAINRRAEENSTLDRRIPRRETFDAEAEASRVTPFSEAYPWQFKSILPYGFTIGAGWLPEVQAVVEYVDRILVRKVDRTIFSWLQIKEKFGYLEMYARVEIALSPESIFLSERDAFDGFEVLKVVAGDRLVVDGEEAKFRIADPLPRQIFDRIQGASRRCATVCEVCGAPGQHIRKGWRRVRCQEHYDGSDDDE